MTPESAGRRYLETAAALVGRLATDAAWPSIDAAAEVLAATLGRCGTVHAFGTGHSHMLAEELYYRAGGLVAVRPILFEGLMLHTGATRSTELERLPGLAKILLDDHGVAEGDALVVASNSGGNAVSCELAEAARGRGVAVIAITSLQHATSPLARQSVGPRLHDVADVVIDNGGAPGDAAVTVTGVPHALGPTSTVVGAAIVNAVVVEAVERLVAGGHLPATFASANVAGGDDFNAALGVRP